MRAILILLFLSPVAFAKGLDGSRWKVKSYKISGEEPSWTAEEAEAVNGKSVAFTKDKFTLGSESCKLKITPQQDGKRWTAGETNPCTGDKLKALMVFSLSYEDCGHARFPGFMAMQEGKQAVAFGDGVSFCMDRK